MKTPATTSLLLALFLAGCGGDELGAPPPAVSTGSFLLAADLPDAVGVLAAKKVAAGTAITVYGRVQRTATGVFTLVDDEAVRYCGQDRSGMDDCETPWDYCCENPEEVREATLVVDAVDATGQEVPKDALGIRPLDLVAVRGTLSK